MIFVVVIFRGDYLQFVVGASLSARLLGVQVRTFFGVLLAFIGAVLVLLAVVLFTVLGFFTMAYLALFTCMWRARRVAPSALRLLCVLGLPLNIHRVEELLVLFDLLLVLLVQYKVAFTRLQVIGNVPLLAVPRGPRGHHLLFDLKVVLVLASFMQSELLRGLLSVAIRVLVVMACLALLHYWEVVFLSFKKR